MASTWIFPLTTWEKKWNLILKYVMFWVKEPEKRDVKERKKWGVGKLRQGETTALIPLYREPSSIEKILGEAEREHHEIPHHSLPFREQQKTYGLPSRSNQQTLPLPSRVVHHHKAAATTYHPRTNHQIAAIKIQKAFRGYMVGTLLLPFHLLLKFSFKYVAC